MYCEAQIYICGEYYLPRCGPTATCVFVEFFFFFLFLDAAYIRLTELSNTLTVWEKKQLAYDSEHKTDVYHDFQDFKAKLLIQLDGIEASSIPKIKVKRSTLYNRIEKLSEAFDRKIHTEHYTCPHCVQVKEIRINL